MTLGEKLAMYRKQNNYTQEQLAELLGVSRQAISKWESDLAFPETEKLIKLSDMYGCSLDYLLKDKEPAQEKVFEEKRTAPALNELYFERKSARTVRGIPLWHINVGAGRTATGIFALGLVARGVFSCGLISMGVFSFGVLSLGVVAFGSIALGLLALGAVAVGVIALGAIAVGALALGGCAVGLVSAGGAALGQYVAVGDNARAQVAIGITEAVGEYTHIGEYSAEQYSEITARIDGAVPAWLKWAADIVRSFI
ncbi:MAG: helix-turn-helix transcriptional regulator [Ruminococcaceae bacterium]|nr:helix-turn-helix transcriptional regulator [Oscillospiraceae bacterium]